MIMNTENIKLNVLFFCYTAPPVITKVITDEGGIDGGIVTFHCKASGDPTPQIDWLKNKKKLRSLRFHITPTDGGSVLRISPLRLDRDNDQTIVCQATNDEGEATSSATLYVTEGKAKISILG